MIRPFALGIAALALAIPANSPAETSQPSLLQPVIDRHMEQENTGLAAVIMRDGAVVSEVYLGDAVVEHDVAVTPDTHFQAMSVSKAFVGAALIKTQSLGLVEFNVSILTYLPELSGLPIGESTLKQLESHMAGLTHLGHPDRKEPYVEHFDTASNALSTFIDLPLKGPVVEEYSYSSSSYNLTAAVLEDVHSKLFSEVLSELVTD